MSRHEGVERADRLAPPSPCRCDHGKSTGSGLIEGHNLDGLHERADQTVKFSRSACFSAVAKLGEGDRADAELRGAVFQQTRRYPASATEGEAHRVHVEHVLWHQANGSRWSRPRCCFGRGIFPGQAPRQARNLSGHSSAASRMTRWPSRRTKTSPWAANWHSLGSRTA